MSQAQLAAAMNMTAGNVSHYEQHRQEVPPDVARRLIAVAAGRGHKLTFNDIYGQVAA